MNEVRNQITADQIGDSPIIAIVMKLAEHKVKYPILWIDPNAHSFAPPSGLQTYNLQKVGAELGAHVELYVSLAQYAKASLTVLQHELAERTQS